MKNEYVILHNLYNLQNETFFIFEPSFSGFWIEEIYISQRKISHVRVKSHWFHNLSGIIKSRANIKLHLHSD